MKINLDDLLLIMDSKYPLFKVEADVHNLVVQISPSEQMILKGIITIIKCLTDRAHLQVGYLCLCYVFSHHSVIG